MSDWLIEGRGKPIKLCRTAARPINCDATSTLLARSAAARRAQRIVYYYIPWNRSLALDRITTVSLSVRHAAFMSCKLPARPTITKVYNPCI